ncbi:MAG TPA: PDZ domain-containing protein [Lacunisphaera sp.]|nr:PDZ domain-containing protein [Lacunisphaera sp.]
MLWIRGCLSTLALAFPMAAAASVGMTEPKVDLPAMKVQGDPLEDFGFRVSPVLDVNRSSGLLRTYTPVVDLVLPNTAASKAGIHPGDRIVLADGQATGSVARSLRTWERLQKKKWAEIETGKSRITWELLVEPLWDPGKTRMVQLELPTPPPHWGSTNWQPPAGRTPVVVPEPGPLASRAEEILNNGIWMILRETYQKGFRLTTDAANPLFLCFQWTLWDESGGHRMLVSRQRGQTDIVLEAIAESNNQPRKGGATPSRSPDRTLAAATTTLALRATAYLTSPSGRLEMAFELNGRGEVPPGDASAGFQAEKEFWLHRVGKTSPLWPLGVINPTGHPK